MHKSCKLSKDVRVEDMIGRKHTSLAHAAWAPGMRRDWMWSSSWCCASGIMLTRAACPMAAIAIDLWRCESQAPWSADDDLLDRRGLNACAVICGPTASFSTAPKCF